MNIWWQVNLYYFDIKYINKDIEINDTGKSQDIPTDSGRHILR